MNDLISSSRSVLNKHIIEDYISGLASNKPPENVSKWITSRLRSWIQNKYSNTNKVIKLPKYSPRWASDSFNRGELYNVTLTSKFKQGIDHAIAYLKTQEGDLLHISVEDAIIKGEERIKEIVKNATTEERPEDVETIHVFEDGCKVVSILTQQGLKREGNLMSHWYGDEQYGYINKIKNGQIHIWSFRDNNNLPHATLEYNVRRKNIRHIKLKYNGCVKAEHVTHLKKFFDLLLTENKVWYLGGCRADDIVWHFAREDNIIEIDGAWYDLTKLPEGLNTHGDLDLSCRKITSPPEALKVGGNLYLGGSTITSLPESLEVGGDLKLNNAKIKSLPEGLKVGGNLYLERSTITSLPNNLTVKGNLYISNTNIKTLPEGLQIGGDLNLWDTKVTLLPKGLKVGGELWANGSELWEYGPKVKALPEDLKVGSLYLGDMIQSLPKNLKVGGDLYLVDTGIMFLSEGLKVGGFFNLSGTKINSLPEDLQVGGNLILANTRITSLPEGLQIQGDLDLSGTKITSLPKGLKVRGSLDLTDTKITSLPKGLIVRGGIYRNGKKINTKKLDQ